ncbi:protein kinase domain-containing protein [Lyngbya aestuarii]|uniref:protein kinase domain-containing protein n=1 Tax=Lyngbya aestuarii TaxID=118322 RepID=UPI00403DE226
MHQSVAVAVHCINPDCPCPYPQPWGNKFCQSCGGALLLNHRFVPLQYLGSGGFARLYTVWDLLSQREQVLKVLVETSPKARLLFEQEAAVLASLDHPGVPRVEQDSYFSLRLDNPQGRLLPCLVMEKINGKTLEDILEEHPQGCLEASVRHLLYQALEILRELHRSGIIHRDIKPSNLMLRQKTGQMVAIDFGGAKQIGSIPLVPGGNSTRLISPGYSPPEQIIGEAVGPQADFYALSRTMIQLLTGQDLADLQDPTTAEFQWRNRVVVSPEFADLLDDMVRSDPQQRPATATEILLRLDMINPLGSYRRLTRNSVSTKLVTAATRGMQLSTQAIFACGRGITALMVFVLQVLTGIVLACLDTTSEMVFGGVGAAMGAAAGFALINLTTVGDYFADWFFQQMPLYLPEVQIRGWRELLLFAIAGLGTGWGLTLLGGFGQQRRFLAAGATGMLGYSVGWLLWQTSAYGTPDDRLLGLISGVAVAPLVLGLGLPSHYLVHALVGAIGTGAVCGGLVWLGILPGSVLVNIFSYSDASWLDFIQSVTFFAFLGVILGFWLGVSYYLLVPVLRWLGWR